SSTVMVCSLVFVFPHASVAVHVLTNENEFPQMGVASLSLGGPTVAVPHVSVAVGGPPVFDGSVLSPHSMVTSSTSPIVGAVLSITVMICVLVAVFPQASFAVHVRVNAPVLPQRS